MTLMSRLPAAATLVALVISLAPASALARQSVDPPRSAVLDRFLAPPRQPLVSYRARRRLTAATRGGRMQASLDVWTTLDPANGFSYEVIGEEGSATIRRRVLIAALDAEQKAVRKADARQTALNPENYEFLGMTGAEDLVKVDVRPRRKQMTLIDGSIYLKRGSSELVRVEGELSARPSFWTRHVKVTREYGTIGGVHVPIAMHSTADVLIVGASTFSMTYQYIEINGQPVADQPGS